MKDCAVKDSKVRIEMQHDTTVSQNIHLHPAILDSGESTENLETGDLNEKLDTGDWSENLDTGNSTENLYTGDSTENHPTGDSTEPSHWGLD